MATTFSAVITIEGEVKGRQSADRIVEIIQNLTIIDFPDNNSRPTALNIKVGKILATHNQTNYDANDN